MGDARMTIAIHIGDCRDVLPTLPERSVQCVVTSPPYWGLRRYSDDPREIGNEDTYQGYITALVEVFNQVRRVMRDDGTLWLNLGDAYANDTKWGGVTSGKHAGGLQGTTFIGRNRHKTGLPSKSLIGLPWRVAIALQDEGWVLRTDIIWHKRAAMPARVDDRPTRDHEYMFLFSKRPHYYYDAAAIAEPAGEHHPSAASFKRTGNKRSASVVPGTPATHRADRPDVFYSGGMRNKRTVWTLGPQPYAGAHHAVFSEALVDPCIKAGSRAGDAILDPFAGSGTTLRVAERLGRDAIGIELNADYTNLHDERLNGVQREMAL